MALRALCDKLTEGLKDPRGWSEFAAQLAEHSARGSALTMRGVQKQRPSLWNLPGKMRNMNVPALIMAGDEDDPCLEPALMMKHTIATAGLAIILGPDTRSIWRTPTSSIVWPTGSSRQSSRDAGVRGIPAPYSSLRGVSQPRTGRDNQRHPELSIDRRGIRSTFDTRRWIAAISHVHKYGQTDTDECERRHNLEATARHQLEN